MTDPYDLIVEFNPSVYVTSPLTGGPNVTCRLSEKEMSSVAIFAIPMSI